MGGPLANVLIAFACAHSHIGSMQIVVDQWTHPLVALGHKVTVATSRCRSDEAIHEEVSGNTPVRIPAWNFLEKRVGLPFPVWSPSAIWPLADLIRRANAVHVYDAFFSWSVLATSLVKRHRRPHFVTQHVRVVKHHKMVIGLAQKLVYSSPGRTVWRQAEMTTAYNLIVPDFLRSHGVPAGKISLAYNGIKTKYYRPGTTEAARLTRQWYGLLLDTPIVPSVGRLVPKKGFHKLLDARSPEYKVMHAGPGAIPHEAPDRVRFLGPGPLNRIELRDLYQASNIFALPALGEMLTLVMREAMACELQYGFDPFNIALVDPEPEVLRSAFLQILRSRPHKVRCMEVYSRWISEMRFEWWENTFCTCRSTLTGSTPQKVLT